MVRIITRADRLMRRYERVAWIILGLVAFAVPWCGIEPALNGGNSALGEGYVALDLALMLAMLAATAAQIARISLAPYDEPAVIRLSAWLMLIALALMAGRITWTMVTQGDVYFTITTSIAIVCLCASIMLHAGGRVVYGGSLATDYGDLSA